MAWGSVFTYLTNLLKNSIPASTTVVNHISRFPKPVGGVITLPDDTHWVIGADINIGANRIQTGARVQITGNFTATPILTYEGTGDMFTGGNGEATFTALKINSPNANQTFNFTDTSAPTFFNARDISIVSTPKIGTFTNVPVVLFELVDCLDCGDGLTVATPTGGQILELTKTIFQTTSSTYKGIDLTTSVFPTMAFVDFVNIALGAPGAVGISGLANSGNVPPGVIAAVQSCEFIGNITPLENITVSDVRWEFLLNSGIPNSSRTIDAYITAPTTVVIGTANTFIDVGGVNWVSDVSERWSSDTAGVLTCLSESAFQYKIDATATVEKTLGGSDEVAIRIAINGVSQPKTTSSTENNTPTTVACQGLFTLTLGDEVTLQIANVDSTNDIDVLRANITLLAAA